MTLNDLKDEISALGFEREIETDKNLLFSIKRALAAVYSERGILNSFFIEHYPNIPNLVFERLTHCAESSETVAIHGKAYSFTVSGTGYFAIEENGVRREHSFSSPLYLWRGFINGDATITFFGEFSFEVFNLAVFESTRSDSAEDLFAYGEAFEYDLSKLKSDFYCIAALPTDEKDREITGVLVRGNRLLIPWGYEGRIKITYKLSAPEIKSDEPNAKIDVSAERERLIALLASAYYWADDAPEKADFYLAMYKDTLKSLKEHDTRALGGGYKNVTGWA